MFEWHTSELKRARFEFCVLIVHDNWNWLWVTGFFCFLSTRFHSRDAEIYVANKYRFKRAPFTEAHKNREREWELDSNRAINCRILKFTLFTCSNVAPQKKKKITKFVFFYFLRMICVLVQNKLFCLLLAEHHSCYCLLMIRWIRMTLFNSIDSFAASV